METMFTQILDCIESGLALDGYDIKSRNDAEGAIIIRDKNADRNFEITVTESAG